MPMKAKRVSLMFGLLLVAFAGIVWATDYIATSGDSASWSGQDPQGDYSAAGAYNSENYYVGGESNLFTIYKAMSDGHWYVSDDGIKEPPDDYLDGTFVHWRSSSTDLTSPTLFQPFSGGDFPDPGNGTFMLTAP